MSILFYKLNGFNDPSLKHVFIASLPSKLQSDLQRKLTSTNLSIADISLGKIFQMAMLCLDKTVSRRNSLKISWKTKNPSLKLVRNLISRLSVKMKRSVFARPKRKNIFENTSTENHLPKNHCGTSRKKMFPSIERKSITEYNRCFICKKRGHFTRNCPHKSTKVVHLIQHLQHSSLLSANEDVESNFSGPRMCGA